MAPDLCLQNSVIVSCAVNQPWHTWAQLSGGTGSTRLILCLLGDSCRGSTYPCTHPAAELLLFPTPSFPLLILLTCDPALGSPCSLPVSSYPGTHPKEPRWSPKWRVPLCGLLLTLWRAELSPPSTLLIHFPGVGKASRKYGTELKGISTADKALACGPVSFDPQHPTSGGLGITPGASLEHRKSRNSFISPREYRQQNSFER